MRLHSQCFRCREHIVLYNDHATQNKKMLCFHFSLHILPRGHFGKPSFLPDQTKTHQKKVYRFPWFLDSLFNMYIHFQTPDLTHTVLFVPSLPLRPTCANGQGGACRPQTFLQWEVKAHLCFHTLTINSLIQKHWSFWMYIRNTLSYFIDLEFCEANIWINCLSMSSWEYGPQKEVCLHEWRNAIKSPFIPMATSLRAFRHRLDTHRTLTRLCIGE